MTGSRGTDGETTKVAKHIKLDAGPAGETIETDIDATDHISENKHTFATLLAVMGENGEAPNTNVDIVVVVTVVSSYVEKSPSTIDTSGSPTDKDDDLIPTYDA